HFNRKTPVGDTLDSTEPIHPINTFVVDKNRNCVDIEWPLLRQLLIRELVVTVASWPDHLSFRLKSLELSANCCTWVTVCSFRTKAGLFSRHQPITQQSPSSE